MKILSGGKINENKKKIENILLKLEFGPPGTERVVKFLRFLQ